MELKKVKLRLKWYYPLNRISFLGILEVYFLSNSASNLAKYAQIEKKRNNKPNPLNIFLFSTNLDECHGLNLALLNWYLLNIIWTLIYSFHISLCLQ
jgi:hypothetical protein